MRECLNYWVMKGPRKKKVMAGGLPIQNLLQLFRSPMWSSCQGSITKAKRDRPKWGTLSWGSIKLISVQFSRIKVPLGCWQQLLHGKMCSFNLNHPPALFPKMIPLAPRHFKAWSFSRVSLLTANYIDMGCSKRKQHLLYSATQWRMEGCARKIWTPQSRVGGGGVKGLRGTGMWKCWWKSFYCRALELGIYGEGASTPDLPGQGPFTFERVLVFNVRFCSCLFTSRGGAGWEFWPRAPGGQSSLCTLRLHVAAAWLVVLVCLWKAIQHLVKKDRTLLGCGYMPEFTPKESDRA